MMCMPGSFADETSELILQLLIKKGVITQQDVDALNEQIKKAKIPDAEKHAEKSSWAERVKVKGDVRLRHEYERPGTGTYVSRLRVRGRVGIEAKITDTVKGGVAIATGGRGNGDANDAGNARSTNQTLGGVFGTKPIDLDMVYISWSPIKNTVITGGKYKNPLYRPSDLLWDGDLRFEGASVNTKYRLIDSKDMPVDLLFNSGLFILDDLAVDKKDPWLFVGQAGFQTKFTDQVDVKVFGSYYDFIKVRNSKSAFLAPGTADTNSEGSYRFDYNVFGGSGEVTFHMLEDLLPSPFAVPVAVFGEYIYNIGREGNAPRGKGHGAQVGVKLGKKPKKFADWRAVYSYRMLTRSSWPVQFPDADSFSGTTDGYSHEGIFSFGLAKNVWLDCTYNLCREKTQGTDPNDKWSHLIQTDISVKF